ncbi:DUF2079 domain-containing protein [Actinoplanes flavus]|uniref:DUF2079 domain-containing protein n=1 Tax=Actinoplanes flavus TaxID=2820290 RepID=A0ABS3UKQ4_9ACTN|nr:DUF2079 domain-containing protein [Actinoplanes flavus]MBO3739325.1 DUF2079 domain-containing protein [Actinoplanes flavus]
MLIRVRDAAIRTLLSPCGWIVGVAIYLFARWAQAQYDALTVGACDLGIFYQAVQGWANDGWPMVPIKGYVQLGDHFSPAFALLAPLVWIHDSAITLVYAQIVLICLSGIPIYHIFRRRHGIAVGTGMLIAYLCSHAVFGTVAFPVHEVMFGALFLAWGLERMLAGKWTQATILFAALVTVKEDGGLLCAMLGLYALLNRRWKHGGFLIAWGASWFLVTLKFIIPNLNPGGFTYAKDYQASLHADGIFAGIPYMITHPLEILNLMTDQPAKLTTWEQLFIPVGFAALASPLILMIAPVMLSRMLSSRDTQWSSELYYDMPLIPIMFAAVADGFRRIGSLVDRARGLGPDPDLAMAPRSAPVEEPKRPWYQFRTATVMAAIAAPVFIFFAVQDLRDHKIVDWYEGTAAPFNNATVVGEATDALERIPEGVTVRATNNLLIPLLPTNEVTLIGSNVDKGDWAVVDTWNPSCPIGRTEIPQIMKQLDQMGFRQVYNGGRIIVLQRTAPATQPIRGTGTAS